MTQKVVKVRVKLSPLPNLPVPGRGRDRFAAIQIWILVLFLIYVTGSELNHLFGDGELRRILFTHRRSELQLNRRQRIRELRRLSDLADAHTVAEFRDPTSAAHHQLVDIVRRLARVNPQRAL